MAWSQSVAADRIAKHRQSAPEGDMSVFEFSDYMRSRRAIVEAASSLGAGGGERAWFVPQNRAVTTHGVHIYANLLDYNAALIEAGLETEASHARALQLLHLHYSACDHLLAAFEIERVDFHGARLHAVVLTPEGSAKEGERIEKAIAFAAAFREMVAQAGRRYGADLATAVRVGIDSGPAVAVNSGRRSEPEPLFIGSPANHAAKLAVGEEAGIYLTPRAARARSGLPVQHPDRITEELEQRMLGQEPGSQHAGFRRRFDEATAAFVIDQDALLKAHGGVRPAIFNFRYREPPLRTIDFKDHPPSNTIRIPLASLFADIDGFTAYVDQAMVTGQIPRAVTNLHVLRAEMAAVLQTDFKGRKIRFIGDCLHGVLAMGGSREIDPRETVQTAVLTAGGIRSSFDLCKHVLGDVECLGIGIGIEYGATPIGRLGVRGQDSIRCSSSKATCVSEEMQSFCSGVETAIGERAYREGGVMVQQLFGSGRTARNLTYAAAKGILQGVAAPAVVRGHEPLQAHARL